MGTVPIILIGKNIADARRAIADACAKCARKPEDVRIVAISKGFGAEQIAQAVQAGILDIGENYLQEALPKQQALQSLPIRWHFTGHLQRNKARAIVDHFQVIQSVDSWRLAEALNQEIRNRRGFSKTAKTVPGTVFAAGFTKDANSEDKMRKGPGHAENRTRGVSPISVLLQIKTSPQAAHGFTSQELLDGRDRLLALTELEIAGLMTMGYPTGNPEEARPFFRAARELFQALKKKLPPAFKELSMGMSGDFGVAIEEGATIVRIGRAIFGERPEKG